MTVLTQAVRAYLDAPTTAHLATVMPDGSPHAVPVWVGLEGDRIAIITSPRSRKARNIAVDPRVALSMTAEGRPTSMAHVRGRVVATVDGDAGWEIIDRLSRKYLGTPYPLREDRVAYLIEAERAFAQDFA